MRAEAPVRGAYVNPAARRWVAPPPPLGPRDLHRRLPGYQVTPLVAVPALATRLGMAGLLVKDESHRLGLPSFKALGASWAVYRVLCDRLGREPSWETAAELKERLQPLGPLVLVTATDGNHGRAVARMASLLGLRARVVIPRASGRRRADAIAAEGAEVQVLDADYDEAVQRAAAMADDRTLVISDTSWPGYESVPGLVIDGYATMFEEVAEQVAGARLAKPGVVLVQMGVGALAAAALRGLRRFLPGVRVVGVEPSGAACVLRALRRGGVCTLPKTRPSIMAGLNCGTASGVAWPDLTAGLDAAITVGDQRARRAMRLLAGTGIEAGESGAAGLAGLLRILEDVRLQPLRRQLRIGAGTTALVLNTEGATDPDSYGAITGRRPSRA